MGNHIRATERHLPYGIIQRYLPPDVGERAPLKLRTEVGTRFINPGVMKS